MFCTSLKVFVLCLIVSEPTDDFDAIEKCGLIVLFLKISWERMKRCVMMNDWRM